MRCRWDPVYPNHGCRSLPDADRSLRASDAERNEVADRLSRHFADGRLDQIEFKARLDRAIGATTRGDLEGLFDDLPRLDAEPAPTPQRRRRRLVPVLALVVVVSVLSTMSTLSFVSMPPVPWLFIVVIGAYLWYRAGHRRQDHRAPSELGR